MHIKTVLPNAIILVALFVLLAFLAQLAMAQFAQAGPYPRHDHHGISEDKRNYLHTRKDDYEDYDIARHRRDDYDRYFRPSLSELEKHPETEISLERVETIRSTYKDKKWGEGDFLHEGKGWYDKKGNQSYGLGYKQDWLPE